MQIEDTVEVLAVKDEENQRPIPSVWRPVFRGIVNAFVQNDYQIKNGISKVALISEDTASQI